MKSSKPKTNLSDKDLEVLRNHVRLVKGLDVPQKKEKKIIVKESQPKLNSAQTVRRQCIKKRRQFMHNVTFEERKERIKVKNRNRFNRRKSIQFSLNKAFHMRWKKVRRLPVLSSHDREVFNNTGKLPFFVPAFYKPFHPHVPDWSNQEFIFLDENEEKKKNATSTTPQPTLTSSTTSSLVSDRPPEGISTTVLPESMALTTTLAIK